MTQTVDNKVKKLVKDLHKKGFIDDMVKQYMMPNIAEQGKVKANPKIHKTNIPLRTIISSINHPTAKLAEVAEHELDEWVKDLPTYIQDTTHFLNRLEQIKKTLPQKYIMFTMDVRKLYPSIPQREGIEACREALEKRKNKSIPTQAVIDMMKVVLENNIFEFGEDKYLQTEGTAIGSKLGKNFACTYMGRWEDQLRKTCSKKPLTFLRYIDDIFGIWEYTEEELQQFHKVANSIHPQIQLDLKWSTSKIEFLDVLVETQGNHLQTSIYNKPTDKHLYLHAKSDHPETTKKAIAYGLGIRARRICSTEETYQEARQAIQKQLVKRGYNPIPIEKSLTKVDKQSRETLLQYKKHTKNNSRVPLTVTYHKDLPDIQKILHNRLDVLRRSERMSQIFKDPPLTAFRRDSNLKDILVHSKHKKMFEREPIKCKSCVICKLITDTTTHEVNGKKYNFKLINCKTTNIVYGIKCKECKKLLYVGETGNKIYERFQNHTSSIRKRANNPVADHFNLEQHCINSIEIVGLERIRMNDIHLRKIRESFWIKKLKTKHPDGLNQNYGIGDGIRGSHL